MASSSHASASSSSQANIDAVFNEITTSQDDVKLNTYLKDFSKDVREVIFASLLSSGQDPLVLLDVRNNTLGYLYLL